MERRFVRAILSPLNSVVRRRHESENGMFLPWGGGESRKGRMSSDGGRGNAESPWEVGLCCIPGHSGGWQLLFIWQCIRISTIAGASDGPFDQSVDCRANLWGPRRQLSSQLTSDTSRLISLLSMLLPVLMRPILIAIYGTRVGRGVDVPQISRWPTATNVAR